MLCGIKVEFSSTSWDLKFFFGSPDFVNIRELAPIGPMVNGPVPMMFCVIIYTGHHNTSACDIAINCLGIGTSL